MEKDNFALDMAVAYICSHQEELTDEQIFDLTEAIKRTM